MTTVKGLQTSVGDYGKLKVGQEIEVTDRIAKELAEAGLVEIISKSEKSDDMQEQEKKESGHVSKKEMDPTPSKKETSIKLTEGESVKKTRKENEKNILGGEK